MRTVKTLALAIVGLLAACAAADEAGGGADAELVTEDVENLTGDDVWVSCDDGNPCTKDQYVVEGFYGCVWTPKADGTSCGEGLVCLDGGCQPTCIDGADGMCCSGCLMDGVCYPGTHWSACGEYGTECQECGPGTVCVNPILPPGPAHCEVSS